MDGSIQIRFSDDMIGDPNDLDDLIEATGRDVSDVSGDEGRRESEAEEERQGSDDGEENKKKDKSDDAPKKKRKLAPRLNLNPERLKGPRGLTALLKEFDHFKFKGKGQEEEDLERVLARMEHWAHRLHPKLHFEDFITKAEKLCTKKKEMQVYMNRLRMGLETADEEIVREEDDEDEPRTVQNEALNEFDKLLDEQISYYDANPREPARTPKTPSTMPSSPAFVPIMASTLTTEQKELIARKKREAMERRFVRLTQLEEEHLREATAASLATVAEETLERAEPSELAQVPDIPEPSNNTNFSADQRERAARNKQLALERLRARRLAAQGIQIPVPDLNVSSSSDLAVPLSPSCPLASPKVTSRRSSPVQSPKTPSPSEESADDKCHENVTDKTNETGGRDPAEIGNPVPKNEDDLVSSGKCRSEINSPAKLKKLDETRSKSTPLKEGFNREKDLQSANENDVSSERIDCRPKDVPPMPGQVKGGKDKIYIVSPKEDHSKSQNDVLSIQEKMDETDD